MATAIVTDSTAYIPKEIRERLNIHIIPLSVNFGDESFEEEITISVEEFFTKVKEGKQYPKTTQPSVGKFEELYSNLAKDYDEIVTIHISSGISGTYECALQAAKMVENVEVHGFDSGIAAAALAFYAVEAAEMANNGANAAEILQRLEVLHDSIEAYFVVDNLIHLQRGGRLSLTSAVLGSMLQIKPVLHMENKKIAMFEKVRTHKKALLRVQQLLQDAIVKHGAVKAVVMHSDSEADAIKWMGELQQQFPDVAFELSYFGPVLATHLGPGALALTWRKI